jgi:hypothetical protein
MSGNDIDSVEYAIQPIKEILVIISGLAFTMAIFQMFTVKGGIPKDYSQFIQEPISLFVFIFIMINLFRFTYGNLRHLDESFLRKHDKITAFDYVFPLIECLTFCIMTIYQNNFLYFFSIFVILLFIDCIWLAKNWRWEHFATEREFVYQKNWLINNMCAFFLLAIFLIISFLSQETLHLNVALIAIIIIAYFNTFIDFRLNWKDLYFPKREGGET